MLQIHDLEAHNRDFHLGPMTFAASRGFVVLAGHNGAGKSTLMRCITGLQKPTNGKVVIDGGDPFAGADRKRVNGCIGYCSQEPDLPKFASVRQVLAYAAWLKGVPRQIACDRIEVTANELNIGQLLNKRVGALSGGMKRRVCIAEALVHNPALVILDEPTAGLDPVQRVALRETLQRLSLSRLLFVSTHLVEDVEGVAERVLVLNDGHLVFDGSESELQTRAQVDAHGRSPVERGLWSLLSQREHLH